MSTPDVPTILQGVVWHFESAREDIKDLAGQLARIQSQTVRRHLLPLIHACDDLLADLNRVRRDGQVSQEQVSQLVNRTVAVLAPLLALAETLASARPTTPTDKDVVTSGSTRTKDLIRYVEMGRVELARLLHALRSAG